jgi:hypothetical protein
LWLVASCAVNLIIVLIAVKALIKQSTKKKHNQKNHPSGGPRRTRWQGRSPPPGDFGR